MLKLFLEASDENAALRLCYRFGSDNYKLYKDFILYVAAVSSINVLEGVRPAVVTCKNAIFRGTGVGKSTVNDKAKFVSQADVQEVKDCEGAVSPLLQGTRMLSFWYVY